MENIHRETSGAFAGRSVLLAACGAACFAAGWLLSHWSRSVFREETTEEGRGTRLGGDDEEGVCDESAPIVARRNFSHRSTLTLRERRLAKQAANELIRALGNVNRESLCQRDGPRFGPSSGEVGAGAGDGNLRLHEDSERVYGGGCDDHAF